MNGLRNDERGFTLIEVLVAAGLMILVLSATLTTLDVAGQTRKRNEQQNDTQDLARAALDNLTTQVRNLASPTNSGLSTIDTATAYELIFQTNDPNKRWVRYCLANSGTHLGITSVSNNETLWYQTPSAAFISANIAPTAAMKASCPVDPVANPATQQGWASAVAVASHITNRISGQDRPVFTYNASGATPSKITDVGAELFVDYDPTRAPGEVSLASGDYLRNQNEPPTAVILKTGTNGQRAWQFNGTQSSDPEGRTLQYLWYKTQTASPDTSTMPDCNTVQSNATWTCIGTGPLVNYTFTTETGNVSVYLKVIDPGQLSATASTTVQVS